MKKLKKLSTTRISATLPQVMVEDFKAKSELTGLSISRLIYLQLKTRKTIIIVPGELVQAVKELRRVLDKIAAEKTVDAETVEVFTRQVRFYESLVASDREVEAYVS